MGGARKKVRREKVETNMNRHVLFLTMLVGAAMAQEPAPVPPVAPMAPLPRAFAYDMDELRAQVEVLRSQVDVEGIRKSVRAQISALAPKIPPQPSTFPIQSAFAFT